MSLPPLIEVIRRHGLEPKKSLGQHFLLDAPLLSRIAHAAQIPNHAHVVEIGPGPGGLTRALLETPADSVCVVEKDHRCITALQELQSTYKKLQIVETDALRYTLPTPVHIVSNLPYNIGTELLAQWLDVVHENTAAIGSMTLMFQKEVAQRIAAPEGGKERGRLSVLAQWLCEVEMLFDIPPEAFTPPPKVTSSLIRLVPRPARVVAVDKNALQHTLATAFNQRRKMLRASLKPLHADIEAQLEACNINPTRRPETLSV